MIAEQGVWIVFALALLLALLVLVVGTILSFLVLVLAHQFFRARMNE